MRRELLLTFMVIVLGMASSLAQTPVWDDALGTPQPGSYAVSNAAGSLSITQTVPYSPDEDWSIIADNLDMGFRSSGQTWIRVTEISLINSTTVSIRITYAKNMTSYSRSAFLGTANRHTEILQSAGPASPDPEPEPDPGTQPDDPDDDYPDPEEFPGDPDIPEMTRPSSGTQADTSRNFILVELPGGSASRKAITYYDGLGMPVQQRMIDCSRDSIESTCYYNFDPESLSTNPGTDRGDVIRLFSHDAFGRESRSYLPYYRNETHGAYDSDGFANQRAYYTEDYDAEDAERAYHAAGYEPFADGRQTTAALPGKILSQHPTTVRYLTNKADDVELVDVDAEEGSAKVGGHYPAGSLTGTVTTDGDGRVSTVWKDFDGRTVCTEYGSGDELSRTLYGYDFRGNLCWVIMPEGYARLAAGLEGGDAIQSGSGVQMDVAAQTVEISINGEFAENHCYRYRHDSRGRMTAKYRPGAGLTLMAYDRAGNLLFFQDENMRAEANWLTYEYDELGRMTRMGMALDESGIDWTAELPELDTDILIEVRENSVVPLHELTYDFYPESLDTELEFEEVPGVATYKALNVDARGHLAHEKIYTTDRKQYVKRVYHYTITTICCRLWKAGRRAC